MIRHFHPGVGSVGHLNQLVDAANKHTAKLASLSRRLREHSHGRNGFWAMIGEMSATAGHYPFNEVYINTLRQWATLPGGRTQDSGSYLIEPNNNETLPTGLIVHAWELLPSHLANDTGDVLYICDAMPDFSELLPETGSGVLSRESDVLSWGYLTLG